MDDIEEWIEELKAGLEDESDLEDDDRVDDEWRDIVRAVGWGIL